MSMESGETHPNDSQYLYSNLDDGNNEIRLVTLLPSVSFEDPVHITISNVQFNPPSYSPRPRVDEQLIESSLPKNWRAYETPEGRVLYTYFDDKDFLRTTWTHPNPERNTVPIPFGPGDCPSFEPAYEALSYTWGSFSELKKIYVDYPAENKTQPPKTIQIRQNLESALRYLRYVDKSRTLWIDALCINQTDLCERSAEVQRMAKIFQYANRVVVWLGVPSATSTHGLSTLSNLGSQIELSKSNLTFPSPLAEAHVWSSLDELQYDDFDWQAIGDLIKRPWFKRLWIVQEIQYANSRAMVQCGSDQMSWYHFRRAIDCIFIKKSGVPSEVLMNIALPYYLGLDIRHNHSYRPLRWARTQHCLEPVDKIYGMLGMISPELATKIRPDYSLPTSEVYMRFFLEEIRYTQRLESLIDCNEKSRLLNNASWIPNWAAPIEQEMRDREYASGHSCAVWNFLAPDVLQVSGVKVSSVRSLSGVIEHVDDLCNFAHKDGLDTAKLFYPTGETLLDTYAHIYTRGKTNERFENLSSYPKLEEVRRLVLDMAARRPGQGDLLRRILYDIEYNRFACTENGLIGLVPTRAKTGDSIYVLLGATHPFLLRQAQNPGQYEVVGACSYIHGLMNAEALLGPLPAGWSCQVRASFGSLYMMGSLNINTKEWLSSEDDPRLGPRPDGWEYIPQREWSVKKPKSFTYQEWKNKATGQIVDSDPRLSPEALKKRGVKLVDIQLV